MTVIEIKPFAVSHPVLYGGEHLPELPGASEKLVANRKHAPGLPLAARLRASLRRSATQRDLLVGTGLIGLPNKVFACLENAQEDAQEHLLRTLGVSAPSCGAYEVQFI